MKPEGNRKYGTPRHNKKMGRGTVPLRTSAPPKPLPPGRGLQTHCWECLLPEFSTFLFSPLSTSLSGHHPNSQDACPDSHSPKTPHPSGWQAPTDQPASCFRRRRCNHPFLLFRRLLCSCWDLLLVYSVVFLQISLKSSRSSLCFHSLCQWDQEHEKWTLWYCHTLSMLKTTDCCGLDWWKDR